MVKYGRTKDWKCYVDNEGSTDSQGKAGYPPLIEIYFFALKKEGEEDYHEFTKYNIIYNKIPTLVGSGYKIYPCNLGDGSNYPW